MVTREKISESTKRDYLNALTKFFENKLVYKPVEFRNILLKDKRGTWIMQLIYIFRR